MWLYVHYCWAMTNGVHLHSYPFIENYCSVDYCTALIVWGVLFIACRLCSMMSSVRIVRSCFIHAVQTLRLSISWHVHHTHLELKTVHVHNFSSQYSAIQCIIIVFINLHCLMISQCLYWYYIMRRQLIEFAIVILLGTQFSTNNGRHHCN